MDWFVGWLASQARHHGASSCGVVEMDRRGLRGKRVYWRDHYCRHADMDRARSHMGRAVFSVRLDWMRHDWMDRGVALIART